MFSKKFFVGFLFFSSLFSTDFCYSAGYFDVNSLNPAIYLDFEAQSSDATRITYDASGNYLNASENSAGSVSFLRESNENGFIDLSSTNNYLTVSYDDEFDFHTSEAFSISAWINVSYDANANAEIIHGPSNGGHPFRVYLTDSGYLRFCMYDGTNESCHALDFSGHYDSWTLISAVKNNSQICLSINDQDLDCIDYSGINDVFSGSGDLYIGMHPTNQNDFSGQMDDVIVYKTAIGQADIANIFSGRNSCGNGVCDAHENPKICSVDCAVVSSWETIFLDEYYDMRVNEFSANHDFDAYIYNSNNYIRSMIDMYVATEKLWYLEQAIKISEKFIAKPTSLGVGSHPILDSVNSILSNRDGDSEGYLELPADRYGGTYAARLEVTRLYRELTALARIIEENNFLDSRYGDISDRIIELTVYDVIDNPLYASIVQTENFDYIPLHHLVAHHATLLKNIYALTEDDFYNTTAKNLLNQMINTTYNGGENGSDPNSVAWGGVQCADLNYSDSSCYDMDDSYNALNCEDSSGNTYCFPMDTGHSRDTVDTFLQFYEEGYMNNMDNSGFDFINRIMHTLESVMMKEESEKVLVSDFIDGEFIPTYNWIGISPGWDILGGYEDSLNEKIIMMNDNPDDGIGSGLPAYRPNYYASLVLNDIKLASSEQGITLPIITTSAATDIQGDSAVGNGNISDIGGEEPTREIEWGTESGVYTSSCSAGTGGAGDFSCTMLSLTPNTTYHVRAKATNSTGTSYGDEVAFVTLASETADTADCGTAHGGEFASTDDMARSQQKCDSDNDPSGLRTQFGGWTDDAAVDGTFNWGCYYADESTGVAMVDTYVECYANKGISPTCTGTLPSNADMCPNDDYSVPENEPWLEVFTCTSERVCEYTIPSDEDITLPILTTGVVSNIQDDRAVGNGNISDIGGEEPTREIEWGTESGVYTSSCSAGTGGAGDFSCSMTGLMPDTTYYFRAKAINSAGISYGEEIIFITLAETSAPVLTEVTPVTTPTNDNTPEYVIRSSEPVTLSYEGSCVGGGGVASDDDTHITFGPLEDGVYQDCIITATDLSGNTSDPLEVSDFIVDTVGSIIEEVESVNSLTSDNSPSYVFSTSEDISYNITGENCLASWCTSSIPGQLCSDYPFTVVSEGEVTFDFWEMEDGTYDDCVISGNDLSGNYSELIISSFTIDTTAPVLSSYALHNPVGTYTNDTTVTNLVTFSEAVQNVDAADFENTGMAGGEVSAVEQVTDSEYYVTFINLSEGYVDVGLSLNHNITDIVGNTATDAPSFEERYYIDMAAPELTEFSLTPSEVDTTLSNQTIFAELTIVDNMSGVDYVDLEMKNGNASIEFDNFVRTEGNNDDGVFAATAILPHGSAAGDWDVFELIIGDDAENELNMDTASIEVDFGVGSATVTNNATAVDVTDPELTAFSLTPSEVNTTSSDQTITVNFTATDDISGVDDLDMEMHDISGENSISFSAINLESGNQNDGEYTATATLPMGSMPGEWSVAAFDLSDVVENELSMDVTSLEDVFGAGSATVTNIGTVSDTIAPIIAEVTPVTTPTSDNTPEYVFSSDEVGVITYSGGCASDVTDAVVGNNTIIFNTLPDGTYNSCTIVVIDAASNMSDALNVREFLVDTGDNGDEGEDNDNDGGDDDSDDIEVSPNDDGDEVDISKPDMSFSGKFKDLVLSSKKKIYISKDEVKFKGEMKEIAGGKVKIKYKRGSDSDTEEVDIDLDGKWSEKVDFDKDGTYKIKFYFYDADGNEVGDKGYYKMRIDTEDPVIDDMPGHLTKRVGDKVWWSATDDKGIKRYRYYFNGKKMKTDDAFFYIPEGTPPGSYTLEIRAYDKAKNRDIKHVTITVK